jgi:hypothetical protein
MIRVTCFLVFAAFVPASTAIAQRTFPPKTFDNLQVLPKASTAAEIINTMKGFTGALGVRCQFCHVGQEGMPLEQFDFVADERPQKKAARAMIRLVMDFNKQLDSALPSATDMANRVTCFTCHRGSQTPLRSPGQ